MFVTSLMKITHHATLQGNFGVYNTTRPTIPQRR